MNKYIFKTACIALFVASHNIFAQNLTDLAIEKEKAITEISYLGKDTSTVDESIFSAPNRICFDNHCIRIDGKDIFLLSGAFHYYRVPKALWENRFKKMKEAGFNGVETYVPWNWHEKEMPKSPEDFSKLDMTDLEDFLQMAEKFNFYVTVRPGPYICSEWSGGGFPQWLLKKRSTNLKYQTWLQSDDQAFIDWSEHWYKAVAQITSPHQIIQRPEGSGGVIFWQVENEYNRVGWIPWDAKQHYLEQLVNCSHKAGINVPIITCWTDQSCNAKSGPLKGVVDMVNSYPRWDIEKRFGGLVNKQLQIQVGKPLIAGELQGGWYTEVGGKNSWDQQGVAPVQTQNITLYALQRGFCALNYYMLVGGTNLGDWASRATATTYDFAAAIQEDGGVNERFYRLQSIATMLKEFGSTIVRAKEKEMSYHSSDPQVSVALRKAKNGDCFYFVRTEDLKAPHQGNIEILSEGGKNLKFDFNLEPFGSNIYYVTANGDSRWLPEAIPESAKQKVSKRTIELYKVASSADPLPKKWTRLNIGDFLDDHNIYGRHFSYYRVFAPEGSLLEVGRIGNKLVNNSDADIVIASINGQIIPSTNEEDTCATYQLPVIHKKGKTIEVILVLEDKGLHHHTNARVEKYWGNGIQYVKADGSILPLEFAYEEEKRGINYSLEMKKLKNEKEVSVANSKSENSLIQWYRLRFNSPKSNKTMRYHLHLVHQGNGFIYLNGQCIGRCWQTGPQCDYYLPECWLLSDKENIISVSLLSPNGTKAIDKAEIRIETETK